MHVYIFMRNWSEFKCNAQSHPLLTAATASTQHCIIEISYEDSEDDSEEDIEKDSEEDSEKTVKKIVRMIVRKTVKKIVRMRIFPNIPIDFTRNHAGVERTRLYVYSTEKRTYWRYEYVPRNNARGVMKKAKIESA
ncbi:hypothetical protein GH714_016356 [Hevea brasiliensis]|uniref:Uncharacterized protein n=1 Tax=Hevea brasiliensis TaxID=3981 RepID=A0A6A6L235_HEVBR|nr:hypothetical protein GH714_016356 [Hevea brasiliensis]